MLGRSWAPLALVAALGGGCHTVVGNYFANRGRDFGECWRGEVTGPQLGLGVGVRAAGILDFGLAASITTRSDWASWVYGKGRLGYLGLPGLMDFGQAVEFEAFLGWHTFQNARWMHECWGLLPGLLSWVDVDVLARDGSGESARYAWIWSSDAPLRDRVHAFDTEVSVHALLFGIRIGFSPGEILDFVLGWFGVDIAGDDRALAVPATAAAEDPAGER